MTSTAARRRAQADLPVRELQITNWPLRDDAVAAWLVIGAAAALGVTISTITSSTAGGLAAFVALGLAMWRLWVPVRFDLGPDGITQTVFGRRRRVSWRKIAEFSVSRRGVMLYPFPEELRPMAPRSVYVRGGRQLDRLVEIVSYYVGASAGRRSPSSLHRAGELSAGSTNRAEAQPAGSNQAAASLSSSRSEQSKRETVNPDASTELPASPESPAAS